MLILTPVVVVMMMMEMTIKLIYGLLRDDLQRTGLLRNGFIHGLRDKQLLVLIAFSLLLLLEKLMLRGKLNY